VEKQWKDYAMSAEFTCLLVIAAWIIAVQVFISQMSKKEVNDARELRASRAAHPAGKALNRQIANN
jgi:hypothetical protein